MLLLLLLFVGFNHWYFDVGAEIDCKVNALFVYSGSLIYTACREEVR